MDILQQAYLKHKYTESWKVIEEKLGKTNQKKAALTILASNKIKMLKPRAFNTKTF